MTNEKLEALFKFYAKVARRCVNHAAHSPDDVKRLEHIVGMRDDAVALVRDGRREKAMRWLGFMQGTLETLGLYTLKDLKKHSMPEGAKYQEKRR